MKKLILVAALMGCMAVQGLAQIDKIVLINETFTIPSHTPAPDGATYQWMVNGTVIDGAADASYTDSLTAAGTYMFIRQAKQEEICNEWMSSNPYVVAVCPYTGSDLYQDDTHRCLPRTSGAQNWEAYIKDVQDDKIYRIVQMPDDIWWFAQPLARETGDYQTLNDILYYKDTTVGCPASWRFPELADWESMITIYGGENYVKIKTTTDWTGTTFAANGTDDYGISFAPTGAYYYDSNLPTGWHGTTNSFAIGPSLVWCGCTISGQPASTHGAMPVGWGCAKRQTVMTDTCYGAARVWGHVDHWNGANKVGLSAGPLRCIREL
jgi:uncharacterized protein (TIGR02145 family)